MAQEYADNNITNAGEGGAFESAESSTLAGAEGSARATGGDGACVTFGVFDGVHAGHRHIIGRLRRIARESGLSSALLRFELSPKMLDDRPDKLLTVSKETDILISQENPDKIYAYPFTDAEARLTPELFVKQILIDKLNAKIIVAGRHCRFGRNRAGGARTLARLAKKYGYRPVIISPLTDRGEIVSAGMIRDALQARDIAKANRLLANPYTISGVVMPGKALGRRANMPTANLDVSPRKFIPAHGVYATLSTVYGKKYAGLTHIGTRPSVDDSGDVTIESFLFDYSGNLYSRTVKTEIHYYIRETRKFRNLDEVKSQVDEDIVIARKYFGI